MNKKILTLTFAGLLGLASCTPTPTQNSSSVVSNESVVESSSSIESTSSVSSVSTSTESSVSSDISSNVSSISSESLSSSEENTSSENNGRKYDDSYYAIPEGTSNYTFNLSIGGDLIDIAINKELVTGVTYSISFSYTSTFSDTSVVTSSNEDVMRIEKMSETSYKLIPVHEGNAVLHIQDKYGLDRYNHIVYVRDPLTVDEMIEHLSDVEYWVSTFGYGDTYTMTFLFDNEVAISGKISNSAFKSYTAVYALSGESDTEYYFKFVDDESPKHEAALTGFNISKTGDLMHLQYKNGTAAMLYPNDYVIVD